MRNRHKIRCILKKTRWTLAWGIIFFLLSTQQTWAAAACFCEHQNEREAKSCRMRHPTFPVKTHHDHGGMRHAETHHGYDSHLFVVDADTEGTDDGTAGDQACAPLPGFCSCCQAPPQAAVSAASFPVQALVPVRAYSPVTDFGKPKTLAPVKRPEPPHSRPLYLTLSCLLI